MAFYVRAILREHAEAGELPAASMMVVSSVPSIRLHVLDP